MKRLFRNYLPDPWVPGEIQIASRWFGMTAYNSGTFVSANNDAHYLPITFPCDVQLYAMRFAATSATGNYDIGLYDITTLARLVSKGSTALSAAGVKELALPEMRFRAGDTVLAALALSDATDTIIRMQVTATAALTTWGMGRQATAFPLPDPAVPAGYGARDTIPSIAFGVR